MTKENSTLDNEAIMLTLDQMGQTIEVMTAVVRRLRHHLQQKEALITDANLPPQCKQKYPVRRRLIRPQRRILH